MKILAIETSCDDTALAIAQCDKNIESFRILSQAISSQIKIHKKYGGVYPTLARREHQKNLSVVLKNVFGLLVF
jgi:N6-L-threonylcarbamoyladenine synthase